MDKCIGLFHFNIIRFMTSTSLVYGGPLLSKGPKGSPLFAFGILYRLIPSCQRTVPLTLSRIF